MKKREFLRLSSMAAAGTLIAPALTFCGNATPKETGTEKEDPDEGGFATFTLPALPYAYDALEPYIDAQTMEIHHSKHHQGYTDKLNKALENNIWAGKSIEEIMAGISGNDADTALRNNGGGYYNHKLFWESITPDGSKQPAGALATAIEASFGSFDGFKKQFSEAAAGVFGSGWAWLCADRNKLFITSTANQDNPLMSQIAKEPGTPLLGLDVWEHAYYLQYQNKRTEYIENFYTLIDWDRVAARFGNAKS